MVLSCIGNDGPIGREEIGSPRCHETPPGYNDHHATFSTTRVKRISEHINVAQRLAEKQA
jgi:hypothetical protein